MYLYNIWYIYLHGYRAFPAHAFWPSKFKRLVLKILSVRARLCTNRTETVQGRQILLWSLHAVAGSHGGFTRGFFFFFFQSTKGTIVTAQSFFGDLGSAPRWRRIYFWYLPPFRISDGRFFFFLHYSIIASPHSRDDTKY